MTTTFETTTVVLLFAVLLAAGCAQGWRLEQSVHAQEPAADAEYGLGLSEVVAFPNGTLAVAVADRRGADVVCNGRSYHSWSHARYDLALAQGARVRAVAMSQALLVAGVVVNDDADNNNGTVLCVPLSGTFAGRVVALQPPPVSGAGALAGFGTVVAAGCVEAYAAASAPNGGAVGTYWQNDQGELELMETVLPPPSCNGSGHQQFGASLAMTEDLLVVGAPHTNGTRGGFGAVHTFRWDTVVGNWSFEHTLEGSGPNAPLFGSHLDLSCDDDVLAVASPCVPGTPNCTDAVYVFTWQQRSATRGGHWQLNYTLANPHPELSAGASFGTSIAIDTDGVVAVGAPGLAGPGRVYVFRRDQLYATVTLDDADAQFGTSVALHNDVLVVGSPCHVVGTQVCAGSLFMFSVSELSSVVLAAVLAATLVVVVAAVLVVLAIYKMHPSTFVALSKAASV